MLLTQTLKKGLLLVKLSSAYNEFFRFKMKVEKGNKVTVDYEGKLEDGTVFDSSKHGDHSHPLEFVAGSGMVIPGFDKAVIGMEEGEEKEVKIEKNDAYGDYNDKLKQEIPRDVLPPEQKPEKDMMLVLGTPDGRRVPVKILEADDKKIVVDLNHPLAGKNLTFNIKVLKIEAGEESGEEKGEKKEGSVEDLV